MFTTVYQQPEDIYLKQEQFDIIMPDIKFSDFSLEKFKCADYEITIVLSDASGKKIEAKFGYIKSTLTPKTLAKDKLNFYNPELLGCMFKVNNSNLLKKLIRETCDDLELKTLKNDVTHYVFPLKNMVLEVIAYTDGIKITSLN